jgi:hypothetical protein
MRFVVLFFGFFAVLLAIAGGAALLWFDDVVVPLDLNWEFVSSMRVPMGVSTGNAALFMFLAAACGALGVILALCRCGKQGGMLMLIPALGAIFMNPYIGGAFAWLLVLTALLSLFVGPLPLNPDDDAVLVEPED